MAALQSGSVLSSWRTFAAALTSGASFLSCAHIGAVHYFCCQRLALCTCLVPWLLPGATDWQQHAVLACILRAMTPKITYFT
jgi:hypothetical protein